MERLGEVTAVDGKWLEITFCRPADCEKCNACHGGPKTMSLRVKGEARVGDFAVVTLPESVVNGASFMVYLIHDNPFVRNYWCYADDWVSLIHNNVIMFPVRLFGRAVLIYLMGFIVYLLYKAVLWALGKMRPLFWKTTL